MNGFLEILIVIGLGLNITGFVFYILSLNNLKNQEQDTSKKKARTKKTEKIENEAPKEMVSQSKRIELRERPVREQEEEVVQHNEPKQEKDIVDVHEEDKSSDAYESIYAELFEEDKKPNYEDKEEEVVTEKVDEEPEPHNKDLLDYLDKMDNEVTSYLNEDHLENEEKVKGISSPQRKEEPTNDPFDLFGDLYDQTPSYSEEDEEKFNVRLKEADSESEGKKREIIQHEREMVEAINILEIEPEIEEEDENEEIIMKHYEPLVYQQVIEKQKQEEKKVQKKTKAQIQAEEEKRYEEKIAKRMAYLQGEWTEDYVIQPKKK